MCQRSLGHSRKCYVTKVPDFHGEGIARMMIVQTMSTEGNSKYDELIVWQILIQNDVCDV